MNEPDIITTPSGDRLAIMPLADYESLVASAEQSSDGALTMRQSGGSPTAKTSLFRASSPTAFSTARTRFGFGASIAA